MEQKRADLPKIPLFLNVGNSNSNIPLAQTADKNINSPTHLYRSWKIQDVKKVNQLPLYKDDTIEQIFEALTLDHLVYIKKNDGDDAHKILGKGAYGEVELAQIVQKPGINILPPEIIGLKIAVKKINKKSIRNKKIA